jgi:hypothetical protein
VLLPSPITSVLIEANGVGGILANWWDSPAEQIIPVGAGSLSETPRTARESGATMLWRGLTTATRT